MNNMYIFFRIYLSCDGRVTNSQNLLINYILNCYIITEIVIFNNQYNLNQIIRLHLEIFLFTNSEPPFMSF